MGKRARFGLASATVFGLSLLLASTAAAQGQPPPPPPGGAGYGPGYGPPPPAPVDPLWPRLGLYGGFGLGLGEMTADCDGCDDALESLGVNFDIGYRIGPRFGIMLDGWGLGHPEDQVTLVHAIVTIGAQYWLSPPLWIKGGIGSARLSLQYEGETQAESDTVAGFMLAAGYEVVHSPGFSVDLELRAGSGFYEDGTVNNVAIGATLHWHSVMHAY